MSSRDPQDVQRRYTVAEPARHSIHECRDAEEFSTRFAAATGRSVQEVIEQVVVPTAETAVFLVGSLPLGMATAGSDIDFIVLVDDRTALLGYDGVGPKNTQERMAFSNESDLLRSGELLKVINGITVDVTVAITPGVKSVYSRLRNRGPQFSESEVMTLSRLGTGWLIRESPGYLRRWSLKVGDPALDVHCSTRNFVSALGFRQKGLKALELEDIPLALHLGRASVEMAYLAYFASEGLSYLGAKWLAQIGHGRGAAERVSRHPLLKESVPLLFPAYPSGQKEAASYLQAVSGLLTAMRDLIEQKTMYRIAFGSCPLIHVI